MQKSGKLELTWVGKHEKQEPLEPRILIEKPELSYGDSDSGNMLIHGDNLLALRALEQDFAGKVKCIYIDPPFNTQQAFDHYEDGLEHSIWLNLMYSRLNIIKSLLAEEGTLFVHIDDNEFCYLITILDEILGRFNRISIVTFKQASATGHKAINPGVVNVTNFILIYAKNKNRWSPHRLFTARSERDKRYGQFIENYHEPYEKWRFTPLSKAFAQNVNLPDRNIKKELGDQYEIKISEFVLENAKQVVQLARPDYNAVSNAARLMIDASKKSQDTILKLKRIGYSDMYFVGGQRILFYIDKLKIIDGKPVAGEPLTSLWDDILSNNIHNEGRVEFPKGKKPEALIKRCIELSTNPGDLVLDSFLGSGTTAAVAHKMGRRWIGIELGEHAYTHCKVRLDKVVDGEQGGISKSVDWQGGGGYKFYELAPSLLEKHPILPVYQINKEYTFEMLCEAICKLEGFAYKPEGGMHGHSSENRFIHISQEFVSGSYITKLMKEVGDKQSVLIYGVKIQSNMRLPDNVEVKKIPKDFLNKCKFESEVR